MEKELIEDKKAAISQRSLRASHTYLIDYVSRILLRASCQSYVFTEQERKTIFLYSMLTRDLSESLSGEDISKSKVKELYDYVSKYEESIFEQAKPYLEYNEKQF